ncbi:MAG TPA: dienelactone hydrolase family protein [Stellaceae bacterium]|nr:dienelactone hydrolase family protein [Stellaceae bacterium]
MIEIDTGDGKMQAFVARPDRSPVPALVLIQEIFGVNQVMRDLARFFAGHGFLAVVPDLFWRLEPGIQLTDKTQAEWQQALGYMQRFDQAKGVADIARTIDAARHLDGANGKVGAVGYCLGGRMAYLTAAGTDIDASVGYYGVGIEASLDKAADIRKPLMLHIAAKDPYVPPPAQRQIHARLDGDSLVTLFDYAGQDHAFARIGGEHYDKASADLANGRTIEFLKHHLG